MLRKNRKDRREQRRLEAGVRQAEYDGLTTAAKIERALARPGSSKKELARLRAAA